MILLPGMDGTGLLFEAFVHALGSAANTQVVGYPANRPLEYAELHQFVKSVLPGNAPFVILAESFSGPIAIQLAAEGMPQLKGVILCCTFARNPRPTLAWTKALLRFMPVGLGAGLVMNHLLLGRFTTALLRRAIFGAVAQVAPEVVRARARAVIGVDVSAQVARIRVPCLYLRASEDSVVPPSAFDHLMRLLPTMQARTITGPHCLLQVAPSEAAVAAMAFLRDLDTAAVDATGAPKKYPALRSTAPK